jgi:hypothetical protein
MKPHVMKTCAESEIEFYMFVTLVVDEPEWSTSYSGSFTLLMKRTGG